MKTILLQDKFSEYNAIVLYCKRANNDKERLCNTLNLRIKVNF